MDATHFPASENSATTKDILLRITNKISNKITWKGQDYATHMVKVQLINTVHVLTQHCSFTEIYANYSTRHQPFVFPLRIYISFYAQFMQ